MRGLVAHPSACAAVVDSFRLTAQIPPLPGERRTAQAEGIAAFGA
jgi:hypothetical protein